MGGRSAKPSIIVESVRGDMQASGRVIDEAVATNAASAAVSGYSTGRRCSLSRLRTTGSFPSRIVPRLKGEARDDSSRPERMSE